MLVELANCDEPDRYLASQDRSIDLARREYHQLLQIAQGHESVEMRFEAAQLISLLSEADHREELLIIEQEDPDPSIRDLARALRFRSIVAEKVLASGKLDAAGFESYQREVREQAARRLFGRTD